MKNSSYKDRPSNGGGKGGEITPRDSLNSHIEIMSEEDVFSRCLKYCMC